MTSVLASHIILTPTQPGGSRRPQQGLNPGSPHQDLRALPTELPRPPGKAVNSTKYEQTIEKLKPRLRQVRPRKTIPFSLTALVPTQIMNQTALDCLGLKTLPHTPCSPDLASFHFFPKLKEHFKGNHYENDDAVEGDAGTLCHGKEAQFYTDGIQKLVQWWRL